MVRYTVSPEELWSNHKMEGEDLVAAHPAPRGAELECTPPGEYVPVVSSIQTGWDASVSLTPAIIRWTYSPCPQNGLYQA